MKKNQKGEFLSSRVRYIPINAVRPNPQQPRRSFDETALRELADSISAYGILQPLTVRDRGGVYELVAGERRLRAARIAGLREVPCLIAEVGEEDAALLALIENLQRRDLDYMEEAAAMYASSGFSRLPIYHDSIDNILGVLHEKDFYAAYCRGAKRLSELKSSVLYTTETARISDLLRQLQQNKVHMAVVVDEYGGTQGIVTMEDIMEELVGEIWDEHDEVIEEFRKQSDGSYLVACSADLDDLYDLFDMKPSEEYDASSVSGWVMEEIGRVPDVGDRFRADGLEVCVTRVEHRRVMEIRVRRLPKGDAAPEKVHAHSGT